MTNIQLLFTLNVLCVVGCAVNTVVQKPLYLKLLWAAATLAWLGAVANLWGQL